MDRDSDLPDFNSTHYQCSSTYCAKGSRWNGIHHLAMSPRTRHNSTHGRTPSALLRHKCTSQQGSMFGGGGHEPSDLESTFCKVDVGDWATRSEVAAGACRSQIAECAPIRSFFVELFPIANYNIGFQSIVVCWNVVRPLQLIPPCQSYGQFAACLFALPHRSTAVSPVSFPNNNAASWPSISRLFKQGAR
jgi:hypothetical protein